MPILIFFLYLIIVFIILAIILLYLRQNRFIEAEKNLKKIQEESEELLAAFLVELKEENEQFVTKLNNMQEKINKITTEAESNPQSNNFTYSDVTSQSNKEQAITNEVYSRMLATQKYQNKEKNTENVIDPKDTEEKIDEQPEESTEQRIITLHEAGYNAEEIAKITGKGKTEIELLLKFRRNMK